MAGMAGIFGRLQRIFTSSNKFVEFIRRQPGKMPLIPPVVVIINVVINDDLNISKMMYICKQA